MPEIDLLFRSKLLVDGVLLVENEGLHGMVEKCQQKMLSVGLHVVYIEGFQAGGGVGMVAKYMGPDTDNEKTYMMSGRVSSRYYAECNPNDDTDSIESTKFTICMFRSNSWISRVPRIGDAVTTQMLSYLGKAAIPAVDIDDLQTFRALVPSTPNQNYAWAIFGKLQISSPASYKLCISSDDG
jgi:hypothetical protein